MITALVIY